MKSKPKFFAKYELRCTKCNRLLGRIKTQKAKVEIKCPKCRTLNRIAYCRKIS